MGTRRERQNWKKEAGAGPGLFVSRWFAELPPPTLGAGREFRERLGKVSPRRSQLANEAVGSTIRLFQLTPHLLRLTGSGMLELYASSATIGLT